MNKFISFSWIQEFKTPYDTDLFSKKSELYDYRRKYKEYSPDLIGLKNFSESMGEQKIFLQVYKNWKAKRLLTGKE